MNAMYTPIFKLSGKAIWLPLSAVLLLTACNSNSDEALEKAEKQAAQQAEENGKIECALAGSTTFNRACETERIAGPDGQILVIRHPDGGFRRFNILTDGRGLSPAQGADPTKIEILTDGKIQLVSGDDMYRLPAKVEASAAEAEPEASDQASEPPVNQDGG